MKIKNVKHGRGLTAAGRQVQVEATLVIVTVENHRPKTQRPL